MRAAARLLGSGLATILAASVVVFAAANLLPGDPATAALGMNATPDAVAALHRSLGLDRPLPVRYATWIAGLATGHAGTSLTYGVPASGLIGARLAVTLPLVALAVVGSVAIGLPLGVLAAQCRGRALDLAAMGTAQAAKSVPEFWLAVMLILAFSLRRHWFSASGFPGWHAGAGPALAALVLPATALALPNAAVIARMMRSATVAALAQDYVRFARAKGLGRWAALWRHAVPNALIPTVAVLGLQIPLMLTGAVLVENVFALPGLGRLLLEAINGRDLVLVDDIVVMLAAAVVVTNMSVRAVLGRLDPRARDAGDARERRRPAAASAR